MAGLAMRLDAPVRIVGCMRACTPQTAVPRPRSPRKRLEQRRVSASATPVEVRRGGSDGDETDVHVDRSVDADDVAQETSVLIDGVSRGFREKAHLGTGREQSLRLLRSGPPVALCPEEHFGSVDLNETHALPVAKRNRVSVDHMVHAVDRWCARGFGTNRTEQGQNEADESCFHRSHRTGLVRTRPARQAQSAPHGAGRPTWRRTCVGGPTTEPADANRGAV